MSTVGSTREPTTLQKLDTLMRRRRIFVRPGLTLWELAAELGVTAHRLSELLNDYIGMSFYDYLDSFRVAEASTLLLQRSDMSVVQVGYRCGYRAKATFYRRFTAAFGVPPGKYRLRRQG